MARSYVPVKSGWPSAVRRSAAAPAGFCGTDAVLACPATRAGIIVASAAAAAADPTSISNRLRMFPPRSPAQRLLAPLSVHQLLDELDALEIEQLRVLLDAPMQR